MEQFLLRLRSDRRLRPHRRYRNNRRKGARTRQDPPRPAGEQATLIRDQVFEAINFIEKRDLITVPQYTRDIRRMRMMTPAEQRVNQFFLGGEQIIVSFPTADIPHEAKMMNMRGNNIHFPRATVHHEGIPGHHLQRHTTQRRRPWSRAFYMPFWIEGWALYWEMCLWDLGFPQTPENRIGIPFSLNFHLEKWSDDEIRRSFEANYPPLYQAACSSAPSTPNSSLPAKWPKSSSTTPSSKTAHPPLSSFARH